MRRPERGRSRLSWRSAKYCSGSTSRNCISDDSSACGGGGAVVRAGLSPEGVPIEGIVNINASTAKLSSQSGKDISQARGFSRLKWDVRLLTSPKSDAPWRDLEHRFFKLTMPRGGRQDHEWNKKVAAGSSRRLRRHYCLRSSL